MPVSLNCYRAWVPTQYFVSEVLSLPMYFFHFHKLSYFQLPSTLLSEFIHILDPQRKHGNALGLSDKTTFGCY